MPAKKESTNRQILQEIKDEVKGIKGMQTSQAQELKSHGRDLKILNEWKRGKEIGQAAVDEYKRRERGERDAKQKRELMKQAAYVLGLVGLVLYVYLQSKGIHP